MSPQQVYTSLYQANGALIHSSDTKSVWSRGSDEQVARCWTEDTHLRGLSAIVKKK